MTSVDNLSDDELASWIFEVQERAATQYPGHSTTLAYGPHPDQFIDLWGDQDAPVVIVTIHGGYFAAEFDRSVNEPLARRLAYEGALVANVEYRRTGSVSDPRQTVEDVRIAIAAIVAKSPATVRIVLLGHSAGGFLCLAGSTVPGVAAMLPLAPLTYLRATADGGWDEGAIKRWIGASPEEDVATWARMELAAVGIGDVECIVLHGTEDKVVPIEHSRRFVKNLSSEAPSSILIELPATGHYEFLDPDSSATTELLAVLRLA